MYKYENVTYWAHFSTINCRKSTSCAKLS